MTPPKATAVHLTSPQKVLQVWDLRVWSAGRLLEVSAAAQSLPPRYPRCFPRAACARTSATSHPARLSKAYGSGGSTEVRLMDQTRQINQRCMKWKLVTAPTATGTIASSGRTTILARLIRWGQGGAGQFRHPHFERVLRRKTKYRRPQETLLWAAVAEAGQNLPRR